MHTLILTSPSEQEVMCAISDNLNNGYDINTLNEQGETLLHLECEFKMIDLVSLLVTILADLNITSIFGRTALHHACFNPNEEIILTLIDKGTNVSLRDAFD